MRKILLLLLMLLPLVASAHDFYADGIYYNIINDSEVAVTYAGNYCTAYNEYSGEVVIPETVSYNGTSYLVTSISKEAFYGCTGLTSVIVPNSVTSIGLNAFTNTQWYNNHPDGLVYAGLVVYSYKGEMPSDTSITLLDGTLGIAERAFYDRDELKSVVIPNSLVSIGVGAFENCNGLISVTMGNSVISIGHAAFVDCRSLASIDFPNSVISIGNSAFERCTGLTSIDIPNSVTTIGHAAFLSCGSLTRITVASDNLYYDSRENCNCIIETATNQLIQGCNNSIIPNSVTSIGFGAFSNCSNITRFEIPNSVISIGSHAFSYCTGLTDIVLPNSIPAIESYVFNRCTNLTNILIPNTVTTIGDYAFAECSSLTGIVIPNLVTTIGEHAFYRCFYLRTIEMPNSVTSIGSYAFNGCSSISTLMIVGKGEWQGGELGISSSLYDLEVDRRITSIKGIKICPGTNIHSYSTIPPTCDANTFTNYSATLHIPSTSLAAYFIAEYWSNFANIVGDAVEPDVTISQDSVELNIGNQFNLTATCAAPYSITWKSTNPNIATVSNGSVIAEGVGECDIIAQCLFKRDTCHVVVNDTTVIITLDQQEAMVLPNHILILTPIPNPIVPDLTVSSSDPSVAAARVVNNIIQVVGIKEGTTIITVGSVDGTAIPATCLVTVYTEPGDMNCDGFVNISDVTSLIDYLLSGDDSQISTKNADVNGDESINISDVTELIDMLLSGNG